MLFRNKSQRFWLETIAYLAILALAAGLRFIGLEQVPPGFNSDEAVGAVGALQTLQNGPQVYYDGQGGGGALGFWMLAASFALFGPGIAATRGTAAFAGLIAVGASYFAVREMFRPAGQARARWLGLVAMLLFATSRWHISTSRMAFAGILVPMLQIPSIYFLWRGLHTGRRRHFILSGVLLAALLYVYLAGAFAPLVYLAFFLLQAAIARLLARRGRETEPPLLQRHFANLAWCAGIALALVLPVFYLYFASPTQVTERAQEAFILNPLINQGDLWGTLWRSLGGNLSGFGLSLSWLLGRAPANLVLPLPIGLGVFLGLGLALWRLPRRDHAPYLFTLAWLGGMLLPSILSPDLIPHLLRGVGAAPAIYILVALVLVELGQAAASFARQTSGAARWGLPAAAGLILAGSLGWMGLSAYRDLVDYFVAWPQTNDAQAAFHVYAVNMAEEMSKETDGQTTFILPLNTAAGDVAANYTILFLYKGAAQIAYIVDDERTLPKDLGDALRGQRRARLVTWKASKHTGADPKEVLPYYLEKYGRFVERNSYPDFETRTYALEVPAPDFAAAESLAPAAVRFGDQLDLAGYAYGNAGDPGRVTRPEAFSNDLLWLRLRWRLVAPTPQDLKVTVRLQDAQGRPISQIDKLLFNNIWHRPTQSWSPGDEEDTYVLLPLPPGTPPGVYRLGVGIYTEERPGRFPVSYPTAAAGPLALAVGPGNIVDLGQVQVKPARRQPSIEALNLPRLLNAPVAPGLTLAGLGFAPEGAVRPGEALDLPLVWQATAGLAEDYRASLWLRDASGESHQLAPATDLAGPAYPTSAWKAGEVLRGWLPARVPPSTPGGPGEVELRLEAGGAVVNTLSLGAVRVEGWQRSFTEPEPQMALDARFGAAITLLGLDLSTRTLAPGQALNATLFWRAGAEIPASYTAFVHLIGPDGRLHGQVDQVPGGGAYPTSGWLPGEVIADAYAIAVPADAPAGDYQLEIGLYDPATGQRLGAGDEDRVLIAGLRVE
ncbi:MAG: ArnT family glycosyltransferase [Anaerolineae bacterium]